LVPDGTLAAVSGGIADLPFDLPRFGISLVTIQPENPSENVDSQGSAGSSLQLTGGGCACRTGRGSRNHNAELLALVGLTLAIGARRLDK